MILQVPDLIEVCMRHSIRCWRVGLQREATTTAYLGKVGPA